MVIELSGVQFGLKSYARFQNQTSAQHEFNLKSQVHDAKFIYNFITSILRSQNSVAQIQDFLALGLGFCWSTSELVCRKLQKMFYIFLQFDWFC